MDQEVEVKSGAGALKIDPDMVAELTKAFQEPSMTTKVTDAASAYKVSVKLYMSLFKTSKVEEVLVEMYTSLFKISKVEEEMVKQAGISVPWPIILTFAESWKSSMASWRLGWHMTVLISYLYNHCQADLVLKSVCNHLHGAI